MYRLFIEGGPAFMAILTVLLAGLCFAAWKAPRWVKEIGTFALVFGFFSFFLGLRQMLSALQTAPDVSLTVIYGGFKVALIPILYGMVIYLLSLVIRVVQKPRL